MQVSSLCVGWLEDGGGVRSRRKAANGRRVLREVSVDHCRKGMNEVECC